jgi:membrane associated rhomboid family serine protease
MGMDDRSWYVPDEERRGYGSGGVRFSFGPKTPPMTKALLIIIVAVFALQLVMYLFTSPHEYIETLFSFKPRGAVEGFELWRFVTYMFLHSKQNIFHILLNLFLFWMFAREVELHIGKWQLFAFFIFCGIGGAAAICYFPTWYMENARTAGASAAVLGVLAAWGMLWPNRTILLFFVFPIRAKWIVIFAAIIDIASAIGNPHGGIAYLAHLGGLFCGVLFVFLCPRVASRLSRRETAVQIATFEREQDVRQRVDALLEKINREGITSLTKKERKFLTDASKRYRK